MKNLKPFAIFGLLCLCLLSAGCSDDDAPLPEPEPQAAPIVASNEFETDDVTGIWQDTIELDTTALLTINASAVATYNGSIRNAGIALFIRLNDEVLASDYSFEGESQSITFRSSASTTVLLQPGRYNLEIERINNSVNANFNLRANYFAILATEGD